MCSSDLLDEAADIDRFFLQNHGNHTAFHIESSHDGDRLKTQFFLRNLHRSVPCLSPVPCSDLITGEYCFVAENNVLALLDQSDYFRQNFALGLSLTLDLRFCHFLSEFERTQLDMVMAVNLPQLVD